MDRWNLGVGRVGLGGARSREPGKAGGGGVRIGKAYLRSWDKKGAWQMFLWVTSFPAVFKRKGYKGCGGIRGGKERR